MSDQKAGWRSKFFLSTEDKDKVSRERNKEDFELSDEARVNLPNYSPDVVLNSFLERNENMNQRFFAKTWEKMKRNIIGQTMWIAIIYLFFYYLIQILFVQQLVNTSGWFSRNLSREGLLTDPNCQTDFCKCCKTINITTTDFIGGCSDLQGPVFIPHPVIDRCVEAKNVEKLVASYKTKQSRLVF